MAASGNTTSVTAAGQPLQAEIVLTREVFLLDELIGPAVLEVNGWPGFARTTVITGVDIAGLLAAYLLTGRR